MFDPETLAIDEAATAEARAAERRARVARSRPYSEFVKDWSKPTPPSHLQYFGAWGDDVSVLYMGGPEKTRSADTPRPNYMPHPKDVRIAELEARLSAFGGMGGEKQ
ncbi:hypothetical protein [Xanthobacter dioxanivorans]|uniref:hypothetical protein n=1 Tax=Xanthobacter dioxanivorans TaxID=2528964 RepID=UPI001E5DC786|nr:hypothetical protein [Xanthobacter dioxanivorans]